MKRIFLWFILIIGLCASRDATTLSRRLLSSDSESGDDSDSGNDTPSPTPSSLSASNETSSDSVDDDDDDSDSDSISISTDSDSDSVADDDDSDSGSAGGDDSDSDSVADDDDDDDDSDSGSSGGDDSDSADDDDDDDDGSDSDSGGDDDSDSDDDDDGDDDSDDSDSGGDDDDSDSDSESGDDDDSDSDSGGDDDDDSDSESGGDDDDDSDSESGDDDDSDSDDDDDDDDDSDSESGGDDDDDSDSDSGDDDDSDSESGDDDDSDSDSDDDDDSSSDDDDSTPSPVTPSPVTLAPTATTMTTTTATPTTGAPTSPTAAPTPSPTNELLDSVLSADDSVEGTFDNEWNASQVDFVVEPSDDWDNALCTIDVSGANMTISLDDGTVIFYVDDGSSNTVILSQGNNYTATVWQTDQDVDDWIASMECTSAAPTTEPTAEPTASPSPGPTTLSPTSAAPTVSPSMAPTYAVCDTNDSLNIGILMDESGSVSSAEWDVMVDFVSRIATYDFAGPSYVSLWEFASLVAFDQFLDFTHLEEDRSGVDTVTTALDTNNYNDVGTTETWDAVNRALDYFWNYRKNCTDGCDTRNDILFVFTDGTPTDASGHDACPDLIPRLNQSDVDIVVVAVGESEADIDEWIDSVTCLDVADGGKDIYRVTEFTDAAFRTLEELVRNKTCNGLNLPGDSDRGGSPWVYEDGSTGLGPVPTAGGGGTAPIDPDQVSFGSAMNVLLNNEHEKEQFGVGAEVDEDPLEDPLTAVRFENVEISLSPFSLLNLWAMAVLALLVNTVLIVWCMAKRNDFEVEVADRDFADSDNAHLAETDVDF